MMKNSSWFALSFFVFYARLKEGKSWHIHLDRQAKICLKVTENIDLNKPVLIKNCPWGLWWRNEILWYSHGVYYQPSSIILILLMISTIFLSLKLKPYCSGFLTFRSHTFSIFLSWPTSVLSFFSIRCVIFDFTNLSGFHFYSVAFLFKKFIKFFWTYAIGWILM